ncbi:MAG: SIR2 family protein, partial [Rhodothermales bacterium]
MDWHAVETDIRAIPGNGPVLDELYKILESGEALAMVGAGASAGLWPLWDEFLHGFIEHSLEHGLIDEAEAKFFKAEAPTTPLETAQQLRDAIGDRVYFDYLYETFRDKSSPQTGGPYTQTHQALLRLPLHNYLTLNYDAGLTNARAALYPLATTSYFFWDQEEARRILDRKNYKRLVLHAHGRYDRADSIILTLDDYRRAYANRAFVRLLNNVFGFQKLLIVGFGWSDPYVKQLFNNISRDFEQDASPHIAFVGLDDEDVKVSRLLRKRVEMVFRAQILFYPTRNRHQALTDWLTALADKYATAAGSQTAEKIQPLAVPPQLKTALPDQYVHQPTDDDHYQGRAQDFATLNRWANDPATRTIAVTGIGGQGKTALTGRWLKRERSPELAQAPVFYWSFYEDLDVGNFLEQVVEFCLPIARAVREPKIQPITFILDVIRQNRLVLVLDGLEVLQEEAGSPAHGQVHHPLLRPFLQQWVRHKHQGLMILTSRFQFPQLARFRGVGFHHLNLVRLSEQDGISLLDKLGIRGEPDL